MPHDDDHVSRVKRIALMIGEKENADLKVLEVSAELHDVEREKEDHALRSAEKARKILEENGFERHFIERVYHCISTHSFSEDKKPETLEAKILSDADRLDAIGAIGIARAFMYAGERGLSIEDVIMHFETKLLRLKDLLHTETARKIAEKRHRFLLEFYKRIREEMELKDV